MTQNREQTNGTLVQQMFGPQAGVYAQSKVHISDDSLESVQRLTGPDFSCRARRHTAGPWTSARERDSPPSPWPRYQSA